MLIIWMLPFSAFPQHVKFPKGVYRSLEELRLMQPSDHRDVLIETKKCAYDVTETPRCIYGIVATEAWVDPSEIVKVVWAYSNGDSLFLNCRHFKKLHSQYALALSGNRYFTFYAFSGNSAAYVPAIILGGAVGAAIVGGVKAASTGDEVALYVLDSNTGDVNYVDSEFMFNFLSKAYPALISKYNKEPFRNRSATHLKYFEMINNGETN